MKIGVLGGGGFGEKVARLSHENLLYGLSGLTTKQDG
jgi:hypothetical protein